MNLPLDQTHSDIFFEGWKAQISEETTSSHSSQDLQAAINQVKRFDEVRTPRARSPRAACAIGKTDKTGETTRETAKNTSLKTNPEAKTKVSKQSRPSPVSKKKQNQNLNEIQNIKSKTLGNEQHPKRSPGKPVLKIASWEARKTPRPRPMSRTEFSSSEPPPGPTLLFVWCFFGGLERGGGWMFFLFSKCSVQKRRIVVSNSKHLFCCFSIRNKHDLFGGWSPCSYMSVFLVVGRRRGCFL